MKKFVATIGICVGLVGVGAGTAAADTTVRPRIEPIVNETPAPPTDDRCTVDLKSGNVHNPSGSHSANNPEPDQPITDSFAIDCDDKATGDLVTVDYQPGEPLPPPPETVVSDPICTVDLDTGNVWRFLGAGEPDEPISTQVCLDPGTQQWVAITYETSGMGPPPVAQSCQVDLRTGAVAIGTIGHIDEQDPVPPTVVRECSETTGPDLSLVEYYISPDPLNDAANEQPYCFTDVRTGEVTLNEAATEEIKEHPDQLTCIDTDLARNVTIYYQQFNTGWPPRYEECEVDLVTGAVNNRVGQHSATNPEPNQPVYTPFEIECVDVEDDPTYDLHASIEYTPATPGTNSDGVTSDPSCEVDLDSGNIEPLTTVDEGDDPQLMQSQYCIDPDTDQLVYVFYNIRMPEVPEVDDCIIGFDNGYIFNDLGMHEGSSIWQDHPMKDPFDLECTEGQTQTLVTVTYAPHPVSDSEDADPDTECMVNLDSGDVYYSHSIDPYQPLECFDPITRQAVTISFAGDLPVDPDTPCTVDVYNAAVVNPVGTHPTSNTEHDRPITQPFSLNCIDERTGQAVIVDYAPQPAEPDSGLPEPGCGIDLDTGDTFPLAVLIDPDEPGQTPVPTVTCRDFDTEQWVTVSFTPVPLEPCTVDLTTGVVNSNIPVHGPATPNRPIAGPFTLECSDPQLDTSATITYTPSPASPGNEIVDAACNVDLDTGQVYINELFFPPSPPSDEIVEQLGCYDGHTRQWATIDYVLDDDVTESDDDGDTESGDAGSSEGHTGTDESGNDEPDNDKSGTGDTSPPLGSVPVVQAPDGIGEGAPSRDDDNEATHANPAGGSSQVAPKTTDLVDDGVPINPAPDPSTATSPIQTVHRVQSPSGSSQPESDRTREGTSNGTSPRTGATPSEASTRAPFVPGPIRESTGESTPSRPRLSPPSPSTSAASSVAMSASGSDQQAETINDHVWTTDTDITVPASATGTSLATERPATADGDEPRTTQVIPAMGITLASAGLASVLGRRRRESTTECNTE